MKRRYLRPALALVLIGALGCGGGEKLPESVKLSGTVKLNGKPLSEGRIMFYPADKVGGSPVPAPIVDGLFLAPVVPKGNYRAAFTSGAVVEQPTGPVSSTYNAPTGKPKKKDPIPEKYRKPSLPVEAMASKSDLNFDLTGS